MVVDGIITASKQQQSSENSTVEEDGDVDKTMKIEKIRIWTAYSTDGMTE